MYQFIYAYNYKDLNKYNELSIYTSEITILQEKWGCKKSEIIQKIKEIIGNKELLENTIRLILWAEKEEVE